MNYKIIDSGSSGNAVIVEDTILIDCGVSFKKLTPHYKNFKIVLLTHIHQDHFNKTTIKRLAKERPTLRFACGKHLVNELLNCDVNPLNIDILEPNNTYDYKHILISPVELNHDVENFGYKLFIEDKKILYATDTCELNFEAKDYDLYFIEANHEEEEINQRIELKESNNQYCHEKRVKYTHLSKEKCHAFILENAGEHSIFEYLHEHVEKEVYNG